MSIGQMLVQNQRVAQSLVLSQEQRILIQNRIFEIRLELIQALRHEEYKPKAECPACGRELTPMEIVRGFNRDPSDFTTCCTSCGRRFEPWLVCFGDGSEVRMPFYCDCQTLAQMHGLETLSPEQLAKDHPGVYRSAIVHHGGIRRAFEKIGIQYEFEEISDWKQKIRPFLGRLPDTVIAECVDTTVVAVRKIRRALGVPRYTVRRTIEEVEEAV